MKRGSKRFAAVVALLFAGAAGAAEPAAPSQGGVSANPLRASWPESDLERLLVAAAEDPSRQGEFVQSLLKADICALTDKPVPADAAKLDDKIALIAVKAPDGRLASPVFTSAKRAQEIFGAAQPYVCAKAAVLLNALRHDRVVLDPGQPYGVMWTSQEIDRILGVERVIDKDTAIVLQPPADAPALFLQRLKATLEAEPKVSSAWLSLAYWPDQKEWSWYLDVQTTLDHQSIQTLVRDAVAGMRMNDRPLDVIVNQPVTDANAGTMLVNR